MLYEKLLIPHEKNYTALLYTTIVDPTNCACSVLHNIGAVWLEPIDPDVTSICHVLDWIGNLMSASSPKKENPSMVQIRILGPNTLSCELNILKQSSQQLYLIIFIIGWPNLFLLIGTWNVIMAWVWSGCCLGHGIVILQAGCFWRTIV